MTFAEMYNLTPRSFFNAVNGFRKQKDNDSKERWIQTRKLMFSFMKPYLSEGVEEFEIQPFPWEENTIKEMTEERLEKIQEETEKVKDYWEEYDRKKLEQQQKTELD